MATKKTSPAAKPTSKTKAAATSTEKGSKAKAKAAKKAAKTARVKAEKQAATKEKTYKVKSGFDAKNRAVKFTRTGNEFQVTKNAVGFIQSFDNKKDASKCYQYQLNCTQN